jgi:hypothetical protein
MIKAVKRTDDLYEFEDGSTMQREPDGLTVTGDRYDGLWVLRDECGFVIDYAGYRNDIAERNNLDLYCAEVAE